MQPFLASGEERAGSNDMSKQQQQQPQMKDDDDDSFPNHKRVVCYKLRILDASGDVVVLQSQCTEEEESFVPARRHMYGGIVR